VAETFCIILLFYINFYFIIILSIIKYHVRTILVFDREMANRIVYTVLYQSDCICKLGLILVQDEIYCTGLLTIPVIGAVQWTFYKDKIIWWQIVITTIFNE
jgi:hypothetical protein